METLLFRTLQRAKTWVKSKAPVNEDLILEVQQIRCNPWLGVTPLEIKGGPVEVNCIHTAVEMAHKYKLEHGKTEVTLSEEFKHHMALFSDEEANKFPPAQGNGDHKIVLMDTAPTCFNCKIYLSLCLYRCPSYGCHWYHDNLRSQLRKGMWCVY